VSRFKYLKKHANYCKQKKVCYQLAVEWIILINKADITQPIWKSIWNSKQFDSECLKLMSQIINEACCNTRWTFRPIILPVIHILVTDISHGQESRECTIKGPSVRTNYLLHSGEHYREFFRGITSADLISRERDGSHLHCPPPLPIEVKCLFSRWLG